MCSPSNNYSHKSFDLLLSFCFFLSLRSRVTLRKTRNFGFVWSPVCKDISHLLLSSTSLDLKGFGFGKRDDSPSNSRPHIFSHLIVWVDNVFFWLTEYFRWYAIDNTIYEIQEWVMWHTGCRLLKDQPWLVGFQPRINPISSIANIDVATVWCSDTRKTRSKTMQVPSSTRTRTKDNLLNNKKLSSEQYLNNTTDGYEFE